MKDFKLVKFNGVFRDYQQRVLDHSEQYLQNNKIHIVAAPGSGKTILGLELIARLQQPTLVFSPTITIRNQWAERFESFIPKNEKIEDYVSVNLKKPQLITSSTYQGLYFAINKMIGKVGADENEENDVLDSEKQDYSKFDIIEMITKMNIKTICLDEAHHLRTEWFKALQKLLNIIPDATIIALTATPPYDAGNNEWNNYISLCGEIDEEVSVPELVAKNNLCPHQDYVFYSLPTVTEKEISQQYVDNSMNAMKEITNSEVFKKLLEQSEHWCTDGKDTFLNYLPVLSGIYSLCEYYDISCNQKILKYLKSKTDYQKFTLKYANEWLNRWKANIAIYYEEDYLQIEQILKKYGLINKKQISLGVNEKINKMLMSSMGKMDSIKRIVSSEIQAMQQDLRMLILTDYIRKESKNKIGTNEDINNISVISAFESIRRENNINLAVLSGTIVILPKVVLKDLDKICNRENYKYKIKEFADTNYVECVFSGLGNKLKVNLVTELFNKGKIQIVIGTKSLLGEGWDSPNINSLILASFVGSFMLSNQMRGRAIRVDKNQPNKISNIWHLVTIIPDDVNDINVISESTDFEMLRRRFDSFVAPNYVTGKIESGLDRIYPLDNTDIQALENYNNSILQMSQNRESVAKAWRNAKNNYKNKNKKSLVVEGPTKLAPRIGLYDVFRNVNAYLAPVSVIATVLCIYFGGFIKYFSIPLFIYSIYAIISVSKYLRNSMSLKRMVRFLIRSTVKMLKIGNLINKDVKVSVRKAKHNKKKRVLDIEIHGTENKSEKKLVKDSINELLSPIDNPRYIIIKKTKNGLNYSLSFAVPKIIGNNKASVVKFAKIVKKNIGAYDVLYTRTEQNLRHLQRAKSMSYINKDVSIKRKSS